jgi:segregation and condensation protein A
VTREQLSVRSEMSRMLKVLERARYMEFTALFAEHADVSHLVVTFLAMLELAREELISIAQTAPYALIHVTLKSAPDFALASDEPEGPLPSAHSPRSAEREE